MQQDQAEGELTARHGLAHSSGNASGLEHALGRSGDRRSQHPYGRLQATLRRYALAGSEYARYAVHMVSTPASGRSTSHILCEPLLDMCFMLAEVHDFLSMTPQLRGNGRRYRLSVYGKAAYVLTTASLQACIEKAVTQAYGALVAQGAEGSRRLAGIRQRAAQSWCDTSRTKERRRQARGGDPEILTAYLGSCLERFQTPSSQNIAALCRRSLGINEILRGWSFGRLAYSEAQRVLDRFVEERHLVAHENELGRMYRISEARRYCRVAWSCTRAVVKELNARVLADSGRPVWDDRAVLVAPIWRGR